MDIQINKRVAQFLTVLFILSAAFGFLIIVFIHSTFDHIPVSLSSWLKFIQYDFIQILTTPTWFIIGGWLFLTAGKYNQDKWTWMLLGFVYREYSLLFFLSILLFQKDSVGKYLIKRIQDILILLVVCFFVHILARTAHVYQIRLLTEAYVFYPRQMSVTGNQAIYLSYADIFFMVLLNTIFAFKMNTMIKELNEARKAIWITATLLLGLFPVIIAHNVILMQREKSHLMLDSENSQNRVMNLDNLATDN
jgi:hypothetical protein